VKQELKIVRVCRKTDSANIGILLVNGAPGFITLEPRDLNNQRHVSCIPEGFYDCQKVRNRTLHNGHKIDETLEVTGVPDRDGILFHSGNIEDDTEGCILLGLGILPGGNFITSSHLAMQKFKDTILSGGDNFTLEITFANG